jgi:uncharacterized protein
MTVMKPELIADLYNEIPRIVEQIPYLRLLVVFGSRARGDNVSSSDWDFALLFDEQLRQQCEPINSWNQYRPWMVLQQIFELDDDEIDWVDLGKASELLANEIAKDGVAIYERELGIFSQFQQGSLLTDERRREIRKSQREIIHSALY